MKSREDKKAFKKFIIIMVISCLAGGVFGFFSNFVEGKPADVIAQGIYGAVKIGLPYEIPVILVIEWIVFGILYTKCKRAYCSAVEEDEVVLDQIDNRLNYILLISSIAMVCSFFVIGCLVPLAESFSLANYFTVLLSFVIALISCLIVQYKVVDLGKKMNPNKKVSIFDLNFAKKWEQNCDEMERLEIYKAAYQSYRAVGGCCIILWCFCSLGSFIWNFGLLPVTMVSIIWLVLTTSYIVAAIRMGEHKDK